MACLSNAASAALREASDVRAMLQRSLVAKAQQQERDNEGLSKRVSLLDQSLRASEAARKRESARRALGHLVNRRLSAGWRSWQAMAAERGAAGDGDTAAAEQGGRAAGGGDRPKRDPKRCAPAELEPGQQPRAWH